MLAVISDIHANIHALNAVLSDIAEQPIDQVIVNGDLVNRGPNNLAVLERVWDLGYPTVLGNHDDLMRKWVERAEDLPIEWFDAPFWRATGWSAEQLDDAGWIAPLAELPLTHSVKLPNAPDILISHGSPRHYREGYGKRMPDEAISEILQMHPADVLVGSHTHQPMERTWGPHQVYNTGAVGAPFNGDPRAQYLILTLREGQWQPTFRKVPYDRTPALEAFETSGLLEAGGLSAHIFYAELKNARSYLTPFWMWSEKQGLEQSWETWEGFQKAFPEYFRPPDEGRLPAQVSTEPQ